MQTYINNNMDPGQSFLSCSPYFRIV